jgi:hypothetical protein
VRQGLDHGFYRGEKGGGKRFRRALAINGRSGPWRLRFYGIQGGKRVTNRELMGGC